MKLKRAVMMAVLAVAVAALAVPVVTLRARAAANRFEARSVASVASASLEASTAGPAATGVAQQQIEQQAEQQSAPHDFGKINPEVIKTLGIERLTKGDSSRQVGERTAAAMVQRSKRKGVESGIAPQSGQPRILDASGALSAALMTTLGGRDNQFDEVTLIADWDGREDCAADREAKVDDFSGIVQPDPNFTLLRTAISEHTIANGFNENIFYYGDSVGNVYVAVDSDGDGEADNVFTINLPTALNAFGSLASDDQIAITGLAVNPVADLTSFFNVNGSYDEFNGQVGEILYVTFLDTESGLRLSTNNRLVRSGLLAFPVADIISPATAPPSPISPTGFPVTIGGAFGVAFTEFSIIGGVAVDDDGSVYFQQADLINVLPGSGVQGGNIVKVTSLDSATFQDRSLAVNPFPTIDTLNPTGGVYGNFAGPVNQVNRFTNYSGTSTTFGNIVALATGSCNVLYAAVARSFVPGAVSFEQLTEGLFQAPAQFPAGLPSMVISFADCGGGTTATGLVVDNRAATFDSCTAPNPGAPAAQGGLGTLPIGNGFADKAVADTAALVAGVNNFRLFVQGNGPDVTGRAIATNASIPGSSSGNTLPPIDFQVDFTLHSGLAVNEEGTVFVISGGTPAGIGKNPSPMLGEILCFEDMCPMDRRADFVDLRGNGFPNPPASGGVVGDGDSDRFDHIFYQSPLDQVTLTPAGLAGLSRGFLRYTNRLAPHALVSGFTGAGLGVTDRTLGDNASAGPILFGTLDPSEDVAGGDDSRPPFRGDDADGVGNPSPVPNGGFEFIFGATGTFATCANTVWNGFFLNSNGNITFGSSDPDGTPTVIEFRSGLAKIAAAWANLNPGSRAQGFLNTFPVQALGFANVNAFRIRWINVPENGREACGSSNTFSITLYDDGNGEDENTPVPRLIEGPTDVRFTREVNTNLLVGCPKRVPGTGNFCLDYCRMDLLGTAARPVIVGYSEGGQASTNPPGLCETNLSEAARAADTDVFRPCLIGEGTEPTIFELFNQGLDARLGGSQDPGQIFFATPDFDLRFEGNAAELCTPIRQRDLNRDKVCFYGKSCPVAPACLTVVPTTPVTVAPGQPAVGTGTDATSTTGIINALCNVQLNLVGCGILPNETTIVCQGFTSETGVPLQRAGKTVTNALALVCDTDGIDGPDLVIALTNVTPVNRFLVRGTLAAAANNSGSQLTAQRGTAFPFACCGGFATVRLLTTFTAGDNNQFGAFTLISECPVDLGVRAPVVKSVTPSGPVDCSNPQDLLISGFCFILPDGTVNVTSVFAVELGNPANVISATVFNVLNANFIDAFFSFGSANAGKTFLIFVTGPNGQSRNLTALPAGAPAGCPLGNEEGIQVTVKCATSTPPGGGGQPPDVAVVSGCKLSRNDAGAFELNITGSNIKQGAKVTVGGVEPKKTTFKDITGNNTFTRVKVKGKVCKGLPGAILITNPGQPSSQPFQCNENCPNN